MRPWSRAEPWRSQQNRGERRRKTGKQRLPFVAETQRKAEKRLPFEAETQRKAEERNSCCTDARPPRPGGMRCGAGGSPRAMGESGASPSGPRFEANCRGRSTTSKRPSVFGRTAAESQGKAVPLSLPHLRDSRLERRGRCRGRGRRRRLRRRRREPGGGGDVLQQDRKERHCFRARKNPEAFPCGLCTCSALNTDFRAFMRVSPNSFSWSWLRFCSTACATVAMPSRSKASATDRGAECCRRKPRSGIAPGSPGRGSELRNASACSQPVSSGRPVAAVCRVCAAAESVCAECG